MPAPTLGADATYEDSSILMTWDVAIEPVPGTSAVLELSLPNRDYTVTFAPDDPAVDIAGTTLTLAVPVPVYTTDTIVLNIDAGWLRDADDTGSSNAEIDDYAVLNRSLIDPPTRTIDLTVNLTGTVTLSGGGVVGVTLTSPSGAVNLKA